MKERKERSVKVIEKPSMGFGAGELGYHPERFRPGLLEMAEKIIESGECIVPVTEPDDGCMDARFAVRVTFLENGHFVEKPVDENGRPHERAKVAGGGAITGVMAELSIGRLNGDTIDEALKGIVPRLSAKGVKPGAHTDTHARHLAGKCGCGACDGETTIMSNAIEFDERLVTFTQHSVGEDFTIEPTLATEIFERWQSELDGGFFEGSTGESRMSSIAEGIIQADAEEPGHDKPSSVIKELGGDHTESFRVKNHVEGKTFSQHLFRQAMLDAAREKYPDMDESELPGVFAIDLWRVKRIAHAVSEDDAEFDRAYTGALLFQEAAIATLGDGTIKEYESDVD